MVPPAPKKTNPESGQTLLGLLLAMVVFAILANAIFTLTTLSFRLVSFSRARITARHLAQERIELIRNLPYEEIGTVGGIPGGSIEQTENIQRNGLNYIVNISIIYVDDPFDGTSPADTLPVDYKRARVDVSWEGLAASRTNPIILATDIAPRGVETTTGGGTLSILIFDANATPVALASVSILADTLDPVVDLTVETNENGRVVLPGSPACTECYRVSVTKDGYSLERTYSVAEIANPNKPYLSVVEGQVTESGFAIDKLSTLNITSVGDRDSGFAPLPSITFQLRGQKTLGTDSDDLPVYKFDKQFTTDSQGVIIITNIEWDNYETIMSSSSGWDIAGTNPLISFSALPDTTTNFTFALALRTLHRLLTVFTDSSSTPIASVSATLSFGAFEEIKLTGVAADPDYGQAFFSDLTDRKYNLDATASGFKDYKSKADVSGYSKEEVILSPE